MSAAEFCVYCDKPVARVPAHRVGLDFSASGARPDAYAHPDCSPSRNRATRRISPRAAR